MGVKAIITLVLFAAVLVSGPAAFFPLVVLILLAGGALDRI